MKVIVAVDYSNFIYRAYFSSINLLEVRPWLPYLRALDMLRTCVQNCYRRWPGCEVEFIFAGDSKRKRLDRMKLDPTYKANRPPLTNLKFHTFRKFMVDVIYDIGCDVLFEEGKEGDDILGSIVASMCAEHTCIKPCGDGCKCANPEFMVVIFTCDKDLNILLKYRNVIIYRPPSVWYGIGDFFKEYGFHPRYFTAYKALIGDKSDGIKGVNGWGIVRAKKHIRQGNWKEVLKEEGTLEQYEHAYGLVQLDYHIYRHSSVPYGGHKINVSSVRNNGNTPLMRKLSDEYKCFDAVSDITFAELRLEEAFNNVA